MLAAAFVVCCAVTLQPGSGDPPSEPGVLGGPAVEAAASRPTLVERDYEGKLRPLEVRAEFAAVGLLGLTDDERAEADEVIEARGAEVEAVVFDNLLLLQEVQTARASAPVEAGWLGGDPALRGRVMEVLRTLTEGEPLVDRIAASLPEESRATYRALVDEWYEAQAAEGGERGRAADRGERRREGRGQGRPGGRGAQGGPAFGRRIAELQAVGLEVKSAYERGVAGRIADRESFIASLSLEPEQEAEVRAVFQRLFEESEGQPTEAQRSEAVAEVFRLLTPEQRREAIRNLRRQ
ncbi:MAG: hypothetical protein ACTS22_08365 [Phycisphaerales bacterium]